MKELLLFLLFCAAVRFGPWLVVWVKGGLLSRRLGAAAPTVREVSFPPQP